MDLLEIIKGRRSIREYSPDGEVPNEEVNRLLEAAIWAPSAGNVQPWHFLVVRDEAVRSELASAAFEQAFVREVPVVIVVCTDLEAAYRGYQDRGRDLYCVQDTAAAIQNILLTAHADGYAACWVGAFSEESASKALKLPKRLRPVAMIPVGLPAESPEPRPRKEIKQVASQM